MPIERTEEGIRWSVGKTNVLIPLTDVIWTVEAPKRKQLYVHYRDAGREKMSAFGPSGEVVFELQPVVGYRLGYLVDHPLQGPSVVLQSEVKVDGWYDWHYSIGSDGQLTRGSPSY